jgi:hypothetical protein
MTTRKGSRKKTSTPRKLGAIKSPERNLRLRNILLDFLLFITAAPLGSHLLF